MADEARAKQERQNSADITDTAIILLVELLFVALPFIIYMATFLNKGKFGRFWELPEWSFAATVLCGLTMIKFVTGILSHPVNFRTARVALFMILVLLVGVLSLVVLWLVLDKTVMPGDQSAAAGHAEQPLPSGLFWAQFGVLLLSLLAFILLGGAGEWNKLEGERKQKGVQ